MLIEQALCLDNEGQSSNEAMLPLKSIEAIHEFAVDTNSPQVLQGFWKTGLWFLMCGVLRCLRLCSNDFFAAIEDIHLYL
jgi:hypothetical protein